MLKKAGIIAAAATAGVLAMSSFAFAASTTNGNVTNTCTFGSASGKASQTAMGSTSVLGGITDTIIGTVTNAATQTNTGNCTNANTTDLFNQDSHNQTKTTSVSKIKHSYNGLAD